MGDEVGFERGVVHDAADRVVGAEVAVGFLVDAVGAVLSAARPGGRAGGS